MARRQAFIPCTPVSLPFELAIAAAETAFQENPQNRPSVDSIALGLILTPQHIAASTSRYWGSKGVRLTVGFLEPTPVDLRNMILSHANAWDEFCNARFVYSQVDPDVRITRTGQGYWSYLGTDIKHIPKGQATMCLQGFTMSVPERERRRVIRHEFGHTLGFVHEHQRREIIARLDEAKVIAKFLREQGWPPSMTRQQVLTPIEEGALLGTPHPDQTSIMAYSMGGDVTKDGLPIIGGLDFSDSDKEFAAKLYPEEVIPKPPEPGEPVLGMMEQKIDFDKKIVVIRLPSGWRVTTLPA